MSEQPYTDRIMRSMRAIDAPYWDSARARQLRLQRCQDCGTWRFPPSTICAQCLSESYAWEPISGRGTIWSWIVMHQHYFPAGLQRDLPYNVIFVTLEEGPQMISTLVDCDIDSAVCGAEVDIAYDECEPNLILPKFRLARSAGVADS